MNRKIEIKGLSNLLFDLIKITAKVKEDLAELKKYDEAIIFRNYEKELRKHFDQVQGNDDIEVIDIKTISLDVFPEIDFSIETKNILKNTGKVNEVIFTKDIVVSILNNLDVRLLRIFERLDVNIANLKNDLKVAKVVDDVVCAYHSPFSLKVVKALNISFLGIRLFKEYEISPLTVFLCILRNKSDLTTEILNKHGITFNIIFNERRKIMNYTIN
jgi:hypothetical protein